MSMEQLDHYGIKYRRNYIVVKNPNDPSQSLRDEKGQVVREETTINEVLLPLSAIQWCHIARRDGAYYMGGCCAHCSAMQDLINTIFRDGGWVGSRLLQELAELAANHEGFEDFEDKELLSNTKALDEVEDPWKKIAVVWQAAKDVLTVADFVERDVNDFDDALSILTRRLHYLFMAKFFGDHDGDSMEKGQRHANQTYSMLKALPALRTVYDHLEKMSEQEFRGFGVRRKGSTEVVTNAYGICIYPNRENAEELLEIWKKSKDPEVDAWEIVPCVVTVNDGLTWVE